ncbi:MAG: hypothetical protein BIFFINMI_03772 [Phycisphaerae bacterium]|nr:hypothetical protein [Phycisphaerae bacterium]
MTPRQRVQATFAGRPADRVPVNYLCNEGIDRRLKSHFGLARDDAEGLRRALGVDFRSVNPRYTGPKLHADPPGVTADDWGIRRRWVEHEAGGYWDYCDWPLRDATVEQVDAWPMPDPDDYDYAGVADACRRFDDYYILAGHPGIGDSINSCGMLRTMEQVLIDLATDEPAGLRLMDRRCEINREIMRRTLAAADGRIDMLWIGEDLGTQRGPTLSLAMFRKHIRPRLQRFVDVAAEFDVPVMIHSCGSSSWAFEDFIDMGIRAADTLQPEARDMAPADLKRRFGGRLAFHGMISTAGAVTYGRPIDVVEDVRRTLEIMKPGGGYALAPTHQLQDNSPTENVLALYEAARELGVY